MMFQKSKKNQVRMVGSHSLLMMALMTDAIGAWATFSVGQYIPSFQLFVWQCLQTAAFWLFSERLPHNVHRLQVQLFPLANFEPRVLWGWMWLAGYLLIHLHLLVRQGAPKSAGSQMGESEQQILRRCYQRYNNALDRWSPRPVSCLRTPKKLCCSSQKTTAIIWEGQTLVVPDLFLHEEYEGQFRMELSRQLMYCNGPDLLVEQILNSYPQHRLLSLGLLLIGNFLCLPVLLTAGAQAHWRRWRILDVDRFAFLLGEGEVLRLALWHRREEQHQAGMSDTRFPTLSERIDQLDLLITDEHQQMRKLGIPIDE